MIDGIPLISKCPACNHRNTNSYQLRFKGFSHIDFSPISNIGKWSNVLTSCSFCGVIYRNFEEFQVRYLSQLFQSKRYFEHDESHVVYKDQVPCSAHEAQAEILASILPNLSSFKAILDIGCFDGKLLSAIAKKSDTTRFVGFDVIKHPGFPLRSNFDFLLEDRSKIRGPFDLVILSQSLIYLDDLNYFLRELKGLLSDSGKAFIHVPDTCVRPSSICLADQVFHFTEGSLKNILSINGFSGQRIRHNLFGRDLMFLVSPDRNALGYICSDLKLYNQNIFDELENLALKIESVPNESVSVFGTTIEAAFTYSLLGDKVNSFVDESPEKVGTLFNGLPVFHPSSIKPDCLCIVPMGNKAHSMVERLSETYQSKFFLI